MSKKIMSALFCLLLISAIQVQSVLAQESNWVATWGTAPALLVEGPPPWETDAAGTGPGSAPTDIVPAYPKMLDDQTIRMIVRTSIGGERIRLQFSNAQGAEPVRMGSVHVAMADQDSSIQPDSDRTVTFGGSTSVTLYPGALVISDPVDLSVPALTELAVSLYLPERSDARTVHELALNTTWVGDGNQTDATEFSDSESNRTYFWLTGMEVDAEPEAGLIVAFGDSITDGFTTTPDAHLAWPAILAERLQDNESTDHLGIINVGISGNRVLNFITGSSALTRFDRDVLARSGVRWIILLEGINDINFTAIPGGPVGSDITAENIIEGLSQLVDRAHAHGFKVMGATLTPMGGLWLHNESTEGMRQTVNDWIRNSGKYDALVDFDAVTRDPGNPQHLNPAHNSGDNIHPNDEGNVAMANAINIAEFLN